MRTTILLLCALLAGCGVEEFRTEDGTRCVMAVGLYATSVDCDWNRAELDEMRQKLADRVALDNTLLALGDRAFCEALAKREGRPQ